MRLLFVFLFVSFSLFGEVGFVPPWGKDNELIARENPIPPLPRNRDPLTQLSEWIILFHQNVVSPADGPRSHFRPTSSRYMLLAMRRYGFIKGYLMGCDRLLRENNETWVYRAVLIDGTVFKWDPTFSPSKQRGSFKKSGE